MNLFRLKNMFKGVSLAGAAITLLAMAAFTPDHIPTINSASASSYKFITGEHLEYRVHYGFINAAEAVVDVSNKYHVVNNRPCYRVDVNGRTTGAFDLVTRVRDSWQSYIDTATILPQAFYMSQREGKYRKDQKVQFDRAADKVVAVTENEKAPQEYKAPENLHDFVSGYYYLRTVDFSHMKEGELVGIKAFYDNEFYDMRVRFVGRETIKTKFGTINTVKIVPVMPNKNNFFEDKDSIRIWISDDENRIPVKAEVDLAIGSIEMDLKGYKNLKSEPRWN